MGKSMKVLEEVGHQVEAAGTPMADKLCLIIDGKSPYNASLPFAVELEVFCTVVDDEFVVTVRNGPDVAARVSNVISFARDQAICQAVQTALGVDLPDELPDLTSELANYGYRYFSKPTGAIRGHTATIMVMADSITELDAALKLGSDPEYIFDLLDGGADPMRQHITFGRPYEVARLRAYIRADYEDVVAYMRAVGAH